MRAATVSLVRLTALHARYQLLEVLRVPIALVGTTVFPAMSLLFFVAPNADVSGSALIATAATAQLSVFAVMSVCLFTYGVGVAEDRSLPWDGYLRTLPAGAVPRLAGRLVTGVGLALLGLAPLVVLAAVLTEATLPVARVLPTVVALVLAGVPLLGLGLAIGYLLPVKAALAVAQVLLLPLAFAGGLFIPPEAFPTWLEALSTWLPTRAGRDLVVTAATGSPTPAYALAAVAAWSSATGSLAVWAYRRDEGRRFR